MIENVTNKDIIKYYETHSTTDTVNYFRISRKTFYKILEQENVERHSAPYNQELSYNLRKKDIEERRINKFLDKYSHISKEELSDYYYSHGLEKTRKHFNLGRNVLDTLLKEYGI